ncbi:hypothetical protein HALLA_00535 (plasmid) [Halostagnicola larsenii XH-48]|uniref:HTH bat-type domain-containing protein n=1 Tax=Halostagnicola larsenii XH-48 TaxID=797299 RepID=W0JX79_9EURY|nr:helix-turn-helix domain-containing protein [Halostagnicola larsenii]AHG01810.1 hypothetical protein HALLA_00535 [Halostagnicola larsenii XH-48]
MAGEHLEYDTKLTAKTRVDNDGTEDDSDRADGFSDQAPSGYQLTFKLWHPNCWMTTVTAKTDGNLLVNSVYIVDEHVKAHVVAYANTTEALETLIEATHMSERTYSVSELHNRHQYGESTEPVRKMTRNLLVEYDPANSIYDALVSRGFIPVEPLRVRDGYEYWTVAVDDPRERMQEKLATVCETKNAEITVQQISTQRPITDTDVDAGTCWETLSTRQREVFKHARDQGYYEWPRAVSGADLAAELDIAKTTFFEHLRKAEAKLLGRK